MSAKVEMTVSRAETARLLADELLKEANERGDQDWRTVEWAVGYLLRRSNEKVGPRPPITGDGGGGGLLSDAIGKHHEAIALRLGRAQLDAQCLAVGHDWYADSEIDAGRGYCRRCGENDHEWLPLPTDGQPND
jgi:hypothetical protein